MVRIASVRRDGEPNIDQIIEKKFNTVIWSSVEQPPIQQILFAAAAARRRRNSPLQNAEAVLEASAPTRQSDLSFNFRGWAFIRGESSSFRPRALPFPPFPSSPPSSSLRILDNTLTRA